MLNFEMSMHLQYDRTERVEYIRNTVGFGECIMAEVQGRGDAYQALTDSGVVVVLDKDHTKMITAFIANIHQALTIYKTATNAKRLPNYFYKVVTRNQRFHDCQPQ